MTGHDLVGLGEVMLRLAAPPPRRLEQTSALDVQIGGAEANVAAACARLGLRTALISALPAEHAWGDRTVRELTGHGVDCAGVLRRPASRMGLYFLEYGAAPRPVRVLYDRRESALSRLVPDEAAGAGVPVSFDVNYRSRLWTPEEAREFLEEILPRLRYLFVGSDDAAAVFKLVGSPGDVLNGLRPLAPGAIIALTLGEAGAAL